MNSLNATAEPERSLLGSAAAKSARTMKTSLAAAGLSLTVLLTWLAGIGVCIHSICVLTSWIHPFLELANHFCVHVLVIAVFILPALLVLKQRGLAIGVGLATGYLLWQVQPWSLVPARPQFATSAGQASFRVLSWNVLSVNAAYHEIQKLVRDVDPDVLVLMEVRPGMLENLPEIRNNYPQVAERPSWGGEGIAVLSRVQNTRLEFKAFGFAAQPAVVTTLPRTDGQELKLVALHTLSPLPVERTRVRNRQLLEVREWSAEQACPLCVCGDFNTTPWTTCFRALEEIGYVDSRRGSGNGPSWPAWLGHFGIPIDHALSKGECSIANRRVLPIGPGSDHRPLVFDITY